MIFCDYVPLQPFENKVLIIYNSFKWKSGI